MLEYDIEDILGRLPSECDYLDYKITPYTLSKDSGKGEYIKDVLAMLNSQMGIDKDKYIIFGVSDNKNLIGIEDKTMADDAVFQSLVSHIRPRPYIRTGTYSYQNKTFGYIKIFSSNTDYTYEVAKDIYYIKNNQKPTGITVGQAFARFGSSTQILTVEQRKKLESSVSNALTLPSQRVLDGTSFSANGVPMLLSMAFIGSWKDSSKEDQNIISIFNGEKYNLWIAKARTLVSQYPDNIKHSDGVWIIKKREDIVLKYSNDLFDYHVDLFVKCVLETLNTINPKYHLPSEKRMYSGIYNDKTTCSELLKKGLSESLAVLKFNHEAFTNCTFGKINIECKKVVRQLLCHNDWKVFQSIGWNLSFLAQAAPEEFIEALESNMSAVEQLLSEQEKSIFMQQYGSELFCALYTIAWDKTYAGSACLLLAKIGAFDNRAISTIIEILLPWHPQTTSSVETRIAIVEEAVPFLGHKGWQLIKGLLPRQTSTSVEHEKPKYLLKDIVVKNVTYDELFFVYEAYLKIGLTIITDNSELIELLDDVTPNMRARIIRHLSDFAKDVYDDHTRAIYWNKLLDLITRHRKYSTSEWALSESILQEIAILADEFKPDSLALQNSRLFCNREYYLYESDDFENSREKLHQKRLDSITQIMGIYGFSGIVELADNSERSELVGRLFAIISNDETANEEQLINMLISEKSSRSNFSTGYIQNRYFEQGNEWLKNCKLEGWTPLQKAKFYALLNPSHELWIHIKNKLADDYLLYWKEFSGWGISKEDIDEAINMFEESNNLNPAIEILYRSIEDGAEPSTELVFRILENLKTDSAELITYYIEELISWLQKKETNPERQFWLEFRYFNLLEEKATSIFNSISTNPNVFMQLIRWLYKRDDKKSDDTETPEGYSEKFAKHAWTILNEWRVMPGLQHDGRFDKNEMDVWIDAVVTMSSDCGRYEVAMTHLGHVSYYAPKNEQDDYFINVDVARMLDADGAEAQRLGYCTEVFNSRGVHFIDPTGEEEFKLEALWTSRAEESDKRGLFRFSQTLRKIAESFRQEAKSNIAEKVRRDQFYSD